MKKLVLIYMLFSLTGMTFLFFGSELSFLTLCLHVFLVSGFSALLVFVISFAKSRWLLIIIAPVFSLAIVLQLLMYTLNILLFKFNNLLLDREILLLFYNNIEGFFSKNNSNIETMLLAIVISFLLFFVLCFLLYKSFSRSTVPLRIGVVSFFWCCFVTLAFFASYDKSAFNVWAGEPFLNLFKNNRVVFNTHHRETQSKADVKEVSDYLSYSLDKPTLNQKNIIIIISDALRYDMIGPEKEQNPFVNDMVNQGKMTFYDNSYSSCPSSVCGILGVLSSKGYGDLTLKSLKVYEILKLYNYRVKFFLSGIHENWIGRLGELYGPNIDDKYTNESQDGFWVDDASIITKFKDNISVEEQPFFAYVHLMSTHFIGIKHESVFEPTLIKPNIFKYSAGMYSDEKIRNRYKNGVYQLDLYLKEMFSALDKQGILKDTIIVVTGDHGDGLGEKGIYTHGKNLSTYQIRVPLLIYGIEEKLYKHTHVSSLDIAPTILDALNIIKPDSWQGLSLLKRQTTGKCSYHEMQYPDKFRLAIICSYPKTGKIFKYEISAKGLKYFYDLSQDPEEINNILGSSEYGAIEKNMRSDLEEYMKKTGN